MMIVVAVLSALICTHGVLTAVVSDITEVFTRSGVMLQLVFGTSMVGFFSNAGNAAFTSATNCIYRRCVSTVAVSKQHIPSVERYLQLRHPQLPQEAKVVAAGEVPRQTSSYFRQPIWVRVADRWTYIRQEGDELLLSCIGTSLETKRRLKAVVAVIIDENVVEKTDDGHYLRGCVLRLDATEQRWLVPEPLTTPLLSAVCLKPHLRDGLLDHAQRFFKNAGTKASKCSGALLMGPLGTGKTTIAFALAASLNIPAVVLNLQAAGLNDDILRRNMMKLKRPCIVIIDEAHAADCLCEPDTKRTEDAALPVVPNAAALPKLPIPINGVTLSGMLCLMDGGSALNSGPKYYVIATNQPDRVSKAILRRCPFHILTEAQVDRESILQYLENLFPEEASLWQRAADLFTQPMFKKSTYASIMQHVQQCDTLASAMDAGEIMAALRIDIQHPHMNGGFMQDWRTGCEKLRGLIIYGKGKGVYRGRTPMCGVEGCEPTMLSALDALVTSYSAAYGQHGDERLSVYMRNQLDVHNAIENFCIVSTCDRANQHHAGPGELMWCTLKDTFPEDRDVHTLLPSAIKMYVRKSSEMGELHERCTIVSAICEEFPDARLDDVFTAAEHITTDIGWCPLTDKIIASLLERARTWQDFFVRAEDFLYGSASNTFDIEPPNIRAKGEVPGFPCFVVNGRRKFVLSEFFKRPTGRYLEWVIVNEDHEKERVSVCGLAPECSYSEERVEVGLQAVLHPAEMTQPRIAIGSSAFNI